MSYIIKIYTPPDFAHPIWILKYEPGSTLPFTTIEGSEHVWVWDFISGSFLKDGEQLVNHTMTIEREEETNV